MQHNELSSGTSAHEIKIKVKWLKSWKKCQIFVSSLLFFQLSFFFYFFLFHFIPGAFHCCCLLCLFVLYVILASSIPAARFAFYLCLFSLFLLFIVVLSDEPKQNQGRGLVDRKLVQTPQ